MLEKIGVAYYLCGSVASSAQGIARSTADVDFVVDLMPQHIRPLTEALVAADFDVDVEMLKEAVEYRRSLNIFSATAMKVDLFVAGFSAWEREQLKRTLKSRLLDSESSDVVLACPEDTVVAKLMWYRKGGEVSDRQWSDILGVLRVQAGRLDLDHMRRWARNNNVSDLLERALTAAAPT